MIACRGGTPLVGAGGSRRALAREFVPRNTPAMATWASFEEEAPDLASVAAELWPGVVALYRDEEPPAGPTFSIAYLATVRPGRRAPAPPVLPVHG